MNADRMGDSLYIVMPAYNEEENIAAVVDAWYPLLSGKAGDSRLVIADAGSTDATHEILLSLKKDRPQLEILSDTEKQHGPKLMALYNLAIDRGADYIFQTDSDGQTDPADFPAFWKRRRSYEAVIAYRPARGDGHARVLVEGAVCRLLWLYFGVKLPDANAPFRLMRTELVEKYLYRLPQDYNIPNIMLTTYFAYYKHHIRFAPVAFGARAGGKSSINIPRIIQIGLKALGDFHAFKKGMKCSEA